MKDKRIFILCLMFFFFFTNLLKGQTRPFSISASLGLAYPGPEIRSLKADLSNQTLSTEKISEKWNILSGSFSIRAFYQLNPFFQIGGESFFQVFQLDKLHLISKFQNLSYEEKFSKGSFHQTSQMILIKFSLPFTFFKSFLTRYEPQRDESFPLSPIQMFLECGVGASYIFGNFPSSFHLENQWQPSFLISLGFEAFIYSFHGKWIRIFLGLRWFYTAPSSFRIYSANNIQFSGKLFWENINLLMGFEILF